MRMAAHITAIHPEDVARDVERQVALGSRSFVLHAVAGGGGGGGDPRALRAAAPRKVAAVAGRKVIAAAGRTAKPAVVHGGRTKAAHHQG